MQTGRIAFSGSSPSTEYWLGADIIAQSQSGNYSVVRLSATAFNRGNASSGSGDNGFHSCLIENYTPSIHIEGGLGYGFAPNATRWDVFVDVNIGHDAAGNMGGVNLRQTVQGWHPANMQRLLLSGFPRIPKRPSKPGTPTASEILPTSMRLSWAASSDNAGSAIDGYLLRRWDNPEGTGTYTDVFANNTSRVVSGLTPGKEYRWMVYAHNGSSDNNGYSDASNAAIVRTLSGMWSKVSGVWRRTIPYVKIAGVWKLAGVFTKVSNAWRITG